MEPENAQILQLQRDLAAELGSGLGEGGEFELERAKMRSQRERLDESLRGDTGDDGGYVVSPVSDLDDSFDREDAGAPPPPPPLPRAGVGLVGCAVERELLEFDVAAAEEESRLEQALERERARTAEAKRDGALAPTPTPRAVRRAARPGRRASSRARAAATCGAPGRWRGARVFLRDRETAVGRGALPPRAARAGGRRRRARSRAGPPPPQQRARAAAADATARDVARVRDAAAAALAGRAGAAGAASAATRWRRRPLRRGGGRDGGAPRALRRRGRGQRARRGRRGAPRLNARRPRAAEAAGRRAREASELQRHLAAAGRVAADVDARGRGGAARRGRGAAAAVGLEESAAARRGVFAAKEAAEAAARDATARLDALEVEAAGQVPGEALEEALGASERRLAAADQAAREARADADARGAKLEARAAVALRRGGREPRGRRGAAAATSEVVAEAESTVAALEGRVEAARADAATAKAAAAAAKADAAALRRALDEAREAAAEATFLAKLDPAGAYDDRSVGALVARRRLRRDRRPRRVRADGFDVCVLAYGATGSGKTHTMHGPASGGDEAGVVPRATRALAEAARRRGDGGWSFACEASSVEIYDEKVYDLLAPGGAALEVKDDADDPVPGAAALPLDFGDDGRGAAQLAKRAARSRRTAATLLNDRSSRSHALFTLRIVGHHEAKNLKTRGSLVLVDLAGSERLKRSGAADPGADPGRLREACAINRSLSCLVDVFAALGRRGDGRGRGVHVPYRNSALTRILQRPLSGDGKALLLATCNPHEAESLGTLKFAHQVAAIETGRIARRVSSAAKRAPLGAQNKRR
ncbi:hypothetical protein JL720_15778 [Aureococcus anophagefferens]|nr:hypothetical protein JL720_15778 [Aureococcus anophagefferens]